MNTKIGEQIKMSLSFFLFQVGQSDMHRAFVHSSLSERISNKSLVLILLLIIIIMISIIAVININIMIKTQVIRRGSSTAS